MAHRVQRSVSVAKGARLNGFQQVHGRLIGHGGQSSRHQIHFDVLSLPGFLSGRQRTEDADRAVETTENVNNGDATFERRAIDRPSDRHEPCGRLSQQIVAGEVSAERGGAVPGYRTVDEPFVRCAESVVAEPVLLHPSW